jgi:hypothetical protein
MANFVYNIALGKIAQKVADGAVLRLLVLKAAGADATLKDMDTLSAVLGEGSTTEADFTNYVRKALASLTATVVDGSNEVQVDCADVTFSSAGGASDNTATDVIIYEDVETDDSDDSTAIPLIQLDAAFTTNGNDVVIQFHADGFFGAS